MIIAVDAMGGEYAPHEIVKGAVKAAEQYKIGIALIDLCSCNQHGEVGQVAVHIRGIDGKLYTIAPVLVIPLPIVKPNCCSFPAITIQIAVYSCGSLANIACGY